MMPCAASIISALVSSSTGGRGKLFHVNVELNLRRDSKRPPVAFCHAMNMEDEIAAVKSPEVV